MYGVKYSIVAVVMFLAMNARVWAHDPIVYPPGMNAGDQYRLAFVTSGTITATSSDIADYNNFATLYASASPELTAIGTTWKALVSTITISARDNTNTNPSNTGVPIYNLGGLLVASSNADLWDSSLLAPIGVDQYGHNQFYPVWSGTGADGTASLSPLGSAQPSSGLSYELDGDWVSASTLANAQLYPIYAISDVITFTPVPEPGSLMLVGSILTAFSTARRGRRQVA